MKGLSLIEAEQWMHSSGVELQTGADVDFPQVPHIEGRKLMVGLPGTPHLAYFSMRAVEWLPMDRTRILWVEKSHGYPPLQCKLIETLRHGCGITRSLSEAPGSLVGRNRDEEYSVEYSSPELSILSGLTLLMIAFDWRGFVAAEHSADQIYIGDEFIGFCSANPERLEAANELSARYGTYSKYSA